MTESSIRKGGWLLGAARTNRRDRTSVGTIEATGSREVGIDVFREGIGGVPPRSARHRPSRGRRGQNDWHPRDT
jgi:hypothetical protein